MIMRLFKSEARVKLLEKLIFRPTEQFYLTHLARITGVIPIQASKELKNLEEAGLVKTEKTGKLRFYSINSESPIYEDLKNIFLKTDSLGDYLKEELKNCNIEHAIIYGSFAEGKEAEHSDIDLLIIGDVEESKLLDTIHKCEKRTSRDINYIVWNRGEFEKKIKEGIHLIKTIASKKIINLIGGEDEFRKLARGRSYRKNK